MATERNIDQAIAKISILITPNGPLNQGNPSLVDTYLAGTYGTLSAAQKTRLQTALTAFRTGNPLYAWNPGYQQFKFSETDPLENGGKIQLYDNPFNGNPFFEGEFKPGMYGRPYTADGWAD